MKKDRKNQNKRSVKSFRVQLTFAFIALTSFCMLVSIMLSTAFLEKFYSGKQIENIEDAFYTINNIAEEKFDKSGEYWLNDDVAVRLDKLSLTDNLKIVLFDSTLPNGQRYVYTTETSEAGLNRILNSMREYIIFDMDSSPDREIIETQHNFKLYLATDEYIESVNYDLVGVLDSGIYCFIRMNYESIEETAAFISNFFAYIGIAIILVEAVFIFLISGRFTRPLKNMNEIAKKMKALDFEAKADADSNNEFGELAGSLNELSETLEKTILELKAANNELQTDLEKRVEIDEMRRDFLGNVSHELKTPIAIIQGYAEGLKENINEDAESREFYCDVIIDEAAKMNTMVKKLLSLNRIEYGESQLEIERFDVVELIRGLLQSASILAGERDIQVNFEETEPHYVYADEYMIEESISNYISNAYHHVAGENKIEVTLTEKDGKIRVSVYNSGSHIPEEDLDKVWEKFYKVDKARTREYGGTGIGLSIVRAVTELHNQSCGVLNRDGGVEFWLELDSSPGVECRTGEENEPELGYVVRLKD